MKKFLLSILTLCALVCFTLGLAACGGGDDDNKKNNDVKMPNGLIYRINSDNSSYSLIDYDSSAPQYEDILIASEVNGKPVTDVKGYVFYDLNTDAGNNTVKTLTIPDSVLRIAGGAFKGMTALETVNIGSGLISLDDRYDFNHDYSPAGVFEGCNNIREFTVSPDNEKFFARDFEPSCLIEKVDSPTTDKGRASTAGELNKLVFSGVGNLMPMCIDLIGEYCFANRTFDESVYFGSASYICAHAFDSATFNDRVSFAGIVDIADYAFQNAKGFDGDLVLPDSLKRIGSGAFKGLTNLASIKIGSGTEYIGYYAFAAQNVTSLRTLEFIEIGEGLKTIEDDAFSRYTLNDDVSVAKELRFLATGEDIEINDFFGNFNNIEQLNKYSFLITDPIMEAISEYNIPVNLVKNLDLAILSGQIPSNFADVVFDKYQTVNISNLVIKRDVTAIADGAFIASSRHSPYYFDNVEVEYNYNRVWGENVFTHKVKTLSVHAEDVKHFSSMTNLNLTGGYVEEHTFDDAQLDYVVNLNIGFNVTIYSPKAFETCTKREKITVDPIEGQYATDSANTYLYDTRENTLVLGTRSTTTIGSNITKIGPYAFANTENASVTVIPEGVTEIGENAFKSCKIENISLPASLTTLAHDTAEKFAFYDCNLRSITVASGNTVYASENGLLYNKDFTQLLYVPKYITINRTELKAIIKDTVKTLTAKAFRDASGWHIVIGSSVERIEAGILNKFSNVTLPTSFYGTSWIYKEGNVKHILMTIEYRDENNVVVKEPTVNQKNAALLDAAVVFKNKYEYTLEKSGSVVSGHNPDLFK